MITEERLQEMEAAPREASIFKAEIAELAKAYRARIEGLRVTNDKDGVWMHIDAPSGKKASLNMEALGESRKGLTGAAILEWVDAMLKERSK